MPGRLNVWAALHAAAPGVAAVLVAYSVAAVVAVLCLMMNLLLMAVPSKSCYFHLSDNPQKHVNQESRFQAAAGVGIVLFGAQQDVYCL